MNTTKTKIVNKHGRTNRPQCKYYSYRIITYSDYAKTEILNEKYYFTQKQITEELGISPSSIYKLINGKSIALFEQYLIIKEKIKI